MGKHIGLSLWWFVGLGVWWLVLAVVTVIIERFVECVPTSTLIVVAIVLAAIAVPMMFYGGRKAENRPAKQARKYDDFDMPILAAIEHMVQTVAHSWDSIDKTEEAFWHAIHKQMVAGRLRVIGAEAPGEEIKRIRKKQLIGLIPVPMRVPPSEIAPHGVRFDLIDEAKPKTHQGHFQGFYDLRVRSRELYRLWPRTLAQKKGGEE